MASSISLSKDTQATVRKVVASGEYASGDDYIDELIRRDANQRMGKKNGKAKAAIGDAGQLRKLTTLKTPAERNGASHPAADDFELTPKELREIEKGFREIEEGRYTAYNKENSHLLLEEIRRKGMKRLAAKARRK